MLQTARIIKEKNNEGILYNLVVKIPLICFYIYLLYNFIKDPAYIYPFYFFDLIIHEGGHAAFIFLGEFLHAAGGTILQLLVPTSVFIYFLQKKEYFSSTFGLAWIGTNLFHIAIYLDDADCMCLGSYISFSGINSDGYGHDWVYLLNAINLFSYDDQISYGVRVIGYLFLASAIIISTKLILITKSSKKS